MFELRIGDFIIREAYGSEPGKIAIYRTDGEGGDFSVASFSDAIKAYYEENF
jgi:hypothetical protein